MKHLIVGLTSLFPALGMLATAPVSAGEDDKTLVARVLSEYYRAFSTLDMQAFSPYYNEPCFIVAPPASLRFLITLHSSPRLDLPLKAFERKDLVEVS